MGCIGLGAVLGYFGLGAMVGYFGLGAVVGNAGLGAMVSSWQHGTRGSGGARDSGKLCWAGAVMSTGQCWTGG